MKWLVMYTNICFFLMESHTRGFGGEHLSDCAHCDLHKEAYSRAAHNPSFYLKQKWFQSDEGAVNGRFLSAKEAHI